MVVAVLAAVSLLPAAAAGYEEPVEARHCLGEFDGNKCKGVWLEPGRKCVLLPLRGEFGLFACLNM